MLEFEELRIRVREIGTRRYLVAASGPASASDIITLRHTPAEYHADFQRLMDMELGLAPIGDENITGRLRKLGREVYSELFGQRLTECLAEALRRARNHRPARGLRLRFDLPAEFRDLPIEALTTPADRPEQHLALGSYSLVRSLAGEPPGARLPDPDAEPNLIHLLVAVASPADQASAVIDAAAEVAALRDAAPEVAIRMTVLEHATKHRLEGWLDDHGNAPTAVLLIAHGHYDNKRSQGVVCLETDDGARDEVPGAMLGSMLAQAQQLRLVLLNLCDGANAARSEPFSGLAQALIARGIPAVVAMRSRVTDTAARRFSPVLVEAICANKTIDEAVSIARRHISDIPAHTSIEWATPALFLHEACYHGWLFKAIEVRDESEDADDPLREGAAALQKYRHPDGHVNPSTLVTAVRYQRMAGQWDHVLRMAQTKRRGQHGQLLADLEQLREEARAELAWPAAEQLCAVLAEGDGARLDGADTLIAGLDRQQPGEPADRLISEVASVRRLSGLVEQASRAEADGDWETAIARYGEVLAERPHGFRDTLAKLQADHEERDLAALYLAGEQYLDTEDWAAAAAAYAQILDRRPDGYRETGSCRAYANGRIAEAARNWPTAVAAYDGSGTVRDAAARSLYAAGHAAAERGEWVQAGAHFTEATRLGLPAGPWVDYSAGRLAEERGDWTEAAAAYQRVRQDAEDVADTGHRLLRAEGRLAAAAGDWLRACEAFAALHDAGHDVDAWLDEAREQLYQQAVAAEEAAAWDQSTRMFAALPAGHADAEIRGTYAKGRAAEDRADWRAAAEFYAGLRYADADARMTYALGRICEFAGQWDEAAARYDAAQPALRNAGERLCYASGRLADQRGDWAGVIDGFGGLPDSYEDGDVGSRRCFARACIAAQREEWESVLGLLGSIAATDRAADVERLRTKTMGGLARIAGDWPAAAASYARAADVDEECRQWRDYSLGRANERGEQWAEALDHYEGLPAELADVQVRQAYARARLTEAVASDAAGWQQAVDAYTALPPEFEDAGRRAGYATIRLAAATEDWATVLRAGAEIAASYRDVQLMVAYAGGRLAEQDGAWQEAADLYDRCAGHRDAQNRWAYVSGRAAEDAGRWRAAIEAYRQVVASTGDTHAADARRRRLERLIAALPWADELSVAELVADPVTLRDQSFPYLTLREAGVTAGSSADEVKNTAFVLMRRGRMTWQERVSWDQLRTPAKRMRLDALLYQLTDLPGLRAQLADLAVASRDELLAELSRRQPADAPLFMLLTKGRDEAIKAWRQQLLAAPGEMKVVHNLAVAVLWQATELEENGAWEYARSAWEQALSCWVTVLSSNDYWVGWRQARAAGYGHSVSADDVSRLRWELSQDLSGRLFGYAERHAQQGRHEQAQSYRELIHFLDIERQGAQVLDESGGLPLPGEPSRVITCGPGFVRMVGLERQLGLLAARAKEPAVDGEEPGTAALRRLRSVFSELASAFTYGAHHRFELSLRALPEIHRRPLAELPAGHSPGTDQHTAGCESCQDFLSRNPAYAFLPDPWRLLQQDAVVLAVWAHLALARVGLTGRPGGLDAAIDHLGTAIQIAGNGAMTVRVRDNVVRMILGRAENLSAEESARRGDRLDEAIALIERAMSLAGSKGRPELAKMLAAVYSRRGVWHAYGCRAYGIQLNQAQAGADLRRALELNPESIHARNNIARRLIFGLAGQQPGMSAEASRLKSLRDALAMVDEGLRDAPANNWLRETLNEFADALEDLLLQNLSIDELAGMIHDSALAAKGSEQADGTQALDDGRYGAMRRLIRAIRQDPSDGHKRTALLTMMDRQLADFTGQDSTK